MKIKITLTVVCLAAFLQLIYPDKLKEIDVHSSWEEFPSADLSNTEDIAVVLDGDPQTLDHALHTQQRTFSCRLRDDGGMRCHIGLDIGHDFHDPT